MKSWVGAFHQLLSVAHQRIWWESELFFSELKGMYTSHYYFRNKQVFPLNSAEAVEEHKEKEKLHSHR